jgi:branched-chain amino acid transport system substrate-binding protein
MKSVKQGLIAVAIAVALGTGAAQAQVSDNVVKIGVLSDMSSLYTDIGGAGSVVAAKMAVEDSGIEKRGYKVEVVSADHQNKPDVGSAIARQWYDVDKVDVIVDGRLVLPFDVSVKVAESFFLVTRPGAKDKPAIASLHNWIRERFVAMGDEWAGLARAVPALAPARVADMERSG